MLVLMTVAGGLVACNQSYLQPLLTLVERYFEVDITQSVLLTTAAQVGQGLGMIFLIPIGDLVEKRRFICIVLILAIVCLIGIAVSPLYYVTLVICFLMGFTSVLPQLLVPVAAELSRPEQRGRAVGTVVSGMVVGIHASRILAGFLGILGLHNDFWYWWHSDHVADSGWKTVFWVAALLLSVLAVILRCKLPLLPATADMSYWRVLKSMGMLFYENGTLRACIFCGMCGFAAFNTFWTCLVFLFRDDYGKGEDAARDAGLFGVVGIVGAVVANLAGRLVDRIGPFAVISVAIIATLVSFFGVTFLCGSLPGLIATVIIMDAGIQAWITPIQTVAQGLTSSARNRVAALGLFITFIAGGAGSLSSSVLYEKFRWQSIGILGIGLVAIGGIIHFICQIGKGYPKQPSDPARRQAKVSSEGSELEITGDGN
jgi:predicted MFS family arabinose efflux permease